MQFTHYSNQTTLLEAGANVNIRDKENHTPLYYAAHNSTLPEIIRDLSTKTDISSIKEALEIAQDGIMDDSRTEIVMYLICKSKDFI